jgi:hypothetical protein
MPCIVCHGTATCPSSLTWLQHALAVFCSGSSCWQLPDGQQSFTAGSTRLGHLHGQTLQQQQHILRKMNGSQVCRIQLYTHMIMYQSCGTPGS